MDFGVSLVLRRCGRRGSPLCHGFATRSLGQFPVIHGLLAELVVVQLAESGDPDPADDTVAVGENSDTPGPRAEELRDQPAVVVGAVVVRLSAHPLAALLDV